jgi:MFS-type transporter involved in bile tolerance (Atg22 family)
MADITPSSMYSRVYGFFNFSGMLSSIFAPYITGYFADQTGSLEFGFYLSGGLLIIGAIMFIFTDNKVKATTNFKTKVIKSNLVTEEKIG